MINTPGQKYVRPGYGGSRRFTSFGCVTAVLLKQKQGWSPAENRRSHRETVVGACSCGTWAQPGMIFRRACGRPAASSCDIGGGVASSCSPTSTSTGTLTFAEFGPQVEVGQRLAGGAEHLRIGLAGTPRGDRAIRSGCCAWNSGANSRRIATSVIAARPLALDAAAMLRKASRPGSENAAPQSARMSLAGDAGMADRHLQRDEAAIAVAEHDRVLAAARRPSPPPPSGRRPRRDRRSRPASRRSPAIPERSPGTISQAPARWRRNWRDPTAASGTETAAAPRPTAPR